MDLTTTYLGMTLRSPIVVGASPLSERIEKIKRAEAAGAAAVVLYSLFEEQLHYEPRVMRRVTDDTYKASEVSRYFPRQSEYHLAAEAYLEHIYGAKQAVSIPLIASLNCTSSGSWTEYAKQIEQAGADALELNIYYIPTDPYLSGAQVERTYIEIVEEVRSAVTIPMAVKLGPYFSNVANIAWKLETAGADGLVLFNRFYQPDIDPEEMEVKPHILLSTPQAMRLPLRWIAILYGRIHADLAASGGIHEARDIVKMLMAGASVTMLCSALLRRGINYVSYLETELTRWLEEHKYGSVNEIQGLMCQERYEDPTAFERAHYIRTLQSYEQPVNSL
ncbi:MAG TPA: dihydroorotate dehydrogenase-like protein [Chloroflexia bacterium]|nr:dihydroorotate dehydrogenase-like protein [Chloroflexia bacterium]